MTAIFDPPPPTPLFDPEPHKMYVLVRRDLSPGLRCAQGMHAAAEICVRHPERAWEWIDNGRYLIVLELPDLPNLAHWQRDLIDEPFPVNYWYEPDLGDELTAIAILPPPERNHYFSELPLAYRETWLDRLIRWTGAR